MSLNGTVPPRGIEPSDTSGIEVHEESGALILAPTLRPPRRRVLFVNSYGGASSWPRILAAELPGNHLWGCIELVRLGYEVALVDPLPHFYLLRRPLPHDLRLLSFIRHWLRPDGIIYCGHTLLFWLPLLRSIGILRNPIVSLTYAREELDFAKSHAGIIALTSAAADQARKFAPRVKVAQLAWGCDAAYYPVLQYDPHSFLACGVTNRDFPVLAAGARASGLAVRALGAAQVNGVQWPENVTFGPHGSHAGREVSYHKLVFEHYRRAVASMVVLKYDPLEYTAVGFTNVLESMALARPVILTRTGAVPGQLDVEREGCGLFVPPNDAAALANAMRRLAADPAEAEAMGLRGRALAERYYNIDRFGAELDRFFDQL